MDAGLTCSDSFLHVMQSQRQTVSLSQKSGCRSTDAAAHELSGQSAHWAESYP